MFSTPLEFLQFVLSLVASLAKVGLAGTALAVIDGIIKEFSGEHIIPIILAAITWVNINYFRPSERPLIYRGRRRMNHSIQRTKDRLQKEIDAVYDEAWFHNLVEDARANVTDLSSDFKYQFKPSWNWL